MVNTMSKLTIPTVTEVKLTKAQLQAEYAVLREAAKAAHDPLIGKFVCMTAAEFKTEYNIAWDLAHPNDNDALPTAAVLQIVDGAVDAVVVAKAEGAPSKMALAKAIFAGELTTKGVAGLVRKDILARFIAEAGCTKAGANTYYNIVRNNNGLVVHNV